jgi:RNA polymerase sigma factor (sigma-70 family)
VAILKDKPKTPTEAYEKLKPMIIRQANRFAKNRRDMFDDYFQDGVIGLMYAYNRYKPDAGMAFSSYAYLCIMTHIKDVAVKNWKGYNRESNKEITDSSVEKHLIQSDSDLMNSLTVKSIIKGLEQEDQIIFRGKLEGKTFSEIAKDLSSRADKKSITLHQVRNRWITLCSDLEKKIEA